jgi:hypothetical protein
MSFSHLLTAIVLLLADVVPYCWKYTGGLRGAIVGERVKCHGPVR